MYGEGNFSTYFGVFASRVCGGGELWLLSVKAGFTHVCEGWCLPAAKNTADIKDFLVWPRGFGLFVGGPMPVLVSFPYLFLNVVYVSSIIFI